MTDSVSAAPVLDRATIQWYYVVLGAALIGGVVYGVLARGFQVGEPVEGGIAAWAPTAIVSVSMVVVGSVLTRVLRTSRMRTVAATFAVTPATGGLFALEIFLAWGVSQLG